MEKEHGNGNTVLLTVIGVATLLVALVGATFAYFSATIDNTQAQSVTLTTANPVGLKYASDLAITLENIIPGASQSQSFTVENPSASTVDQTYDMTLVVTKDTLVTTDGTNQLLVTVSGTTDGANTPALMSGVTMPLDLTDGATVLATNGGKTQLINDQKIAVGEKHTYTMKVEFAELNKDQNTNQGKEFEAHILVDDPKSVATAATPGA